MVQPRLHVEKHISLKQFFCYMKLLQSKTISKQRNNYLNENPNSKNTIEKPELIFLLITQWEKS